MLLPRGKDTRQEEGTKRYIPIDGSVDLDYDKPIARVGAGELIGEAACMNFQPRSATMRAAEDTIIYEMLRNVLDILRRQREFRRRMDQKYKERALSNHLKSVPVFRDLPESFIDELRGRVELVSFAPGEVIVRQGEEADAFYLVRMGHVKVFQTYGDGKGMVLSYLSRSQFFGEMGLLGEAGKRVATCSALDHVEVVRIGKDDFLRMIEQFPQIRARLQAVADQREAMDRDYAAERPAGVAAAVHRPGLVPAQSLLILDLEKCTRCDECVRACARRTTASPG